MGERRAWVQVGVGTAIAVVGILALGMLLFNRYLADHPLPASRAAPPPRAAEPLTGRLVVVVVDSLREDAARDAAVMPRLAEMTTTGSSGVNITAPMTLTTMSVVTMGTGITPSISWSLKNFDAEPFQDESVFSLLRAAGYESALLGDASWTQLYGKDASQTLAFGDHGIYQAVEGGISPQDAETLSDAARHLANPRYDAVVIHVTSSDKAAHRSGAHLRESDGSLSEYAQALHTIDARIGALWDAHRENATWLVLSDHGCSERGNHGGGEEVARRAPFVWVGPGIRHLRDVEQSLNRVAPTLTALLGLRAPRTAELGPAFDLLQLDKRSQAALAYAQLEAREGFVRGTLNAAGLPFAAPTGGTAEARLSALADMTTAVDDQRAWLRHLGLAIGLLLQLILIAALGRAVGVTRPWVAAAVWGGLSWLLLFFDAWQFPSIQLLGEMALSPLGFALRFAIVLVLGGLVLLAIRLARRLGLRDGRAAAWLGWAFVILVLGQSVMRWPFGPLAEMYRSMLLIGLSGAAAWAWYTAHPGRRVLTLGLGLVILFYGLMSAMLGDDLSSRAGGEHHALPNLALVGMLFALAIHSFRAGDPEHRVRQLAPWLWVAALVVGAMAYRTFSVAWLIKPLLIAAIVPIVWVGRQRAAAAVSRNVVFATALVLYRMLAIDERVMILIGVAVVAWVLSELRTRHGALAAPAGVGMVILAQQSYFYEAGFSFSFSSLDMTVAFAATRDAIDLGEGFVFLLAQALGPWMILTTALLYNRAINGDERGLNAAVIALLGAFVIQAWGAFVSFEYQIHNHWFTMHAVPLVLFAMCNALLVGLALAAALTALPRAVTRST